MENLDFMLFDALRHVGRTMRTGHGPGMLAPPGMEPGAGGQPPALQREVILAILSDSGDGLRQKDIAGAFRVSPSTLSSMLDKLEAEEYLERRTDPSDRRATTLTLTEKGRSRAEEIKVQRMSMMGRLFSRLDDEDKKTLIRLLRKMVPEEEEGLFHETD